MDSSTDAAAATTRRVRGPPVHPIDARYLHRSNHPQWTPYAEQTLPGLDKCLSDRHGVRHRLDAGRGLDQPGEGTAQMGPARPSIDTRQVPLPAKKVLKARPDPDRIKA
jgi:hypothetical protein